MAWFKRISLFLLTNILVMFTLSIVMAIVSPMLGIRPGQMGELVLLSLVWGMGGAMISLLLSKQMVKWTMKPFIIDGPGRTQVEQNLVIKVTRLAEKAGLPKVPEIGIYDSPEVNAFATGPTRANSLVVVSSGLLSRMTDDEIDGVLGHEITHIANGDMVTMTLIQGVVNAFAIFFSRIVARLVASQVSEKFETIVYFVSMILFQLVFTILGSILVNYFSRRREYRADAGGARLAGKSKMIAGLRRLQTQVENIAPSQDGLATLKISDRRPSGFRAFIQGGTHPPLEDRIRALEAMN